MRPEFFTNLYGLIVDYLAEYFREMRKTTFADSIDTYFLLGNNLNQRDTIAVRKTVSGLLKLLYPHGEYDKETVEKCLHYALECRRRVKEQLKRLGAWSSTMSTSATSTRKPGKKNLSVFRNKAEAHLFRKVRSIPVPCTQLAPAAVVSWACTALSCK
ncbi:MAG: BREX system Lon protease-like protein BrxL [Desulfovermiculus sp.]|nr:BREX system Lon protease-like protein BrxL [Desulfovermiculus sp.]